jgi:hypothetical protein
MATVDLLAKGGPGNFNGNGIGEVCFFLRLLRGGNLYLFWGIVTDSDKKLLRRARRRAAKTPGLAKSATT